MNKAIIFFILSIICLKAYTQDKTEFRFGLYIRDSKEMRNMLPVIVSHYKNDSYIAALGEKPGISMYVKGEYPEINTASMRPEFFFFFPNKIKKDISLADLAQTIKNYPFSYGKSPNDFNLIRLFRTGNKRAYRLEKERILSTESRYTVLSIDTIPFTIIPMEESAYKVIINSALQPGDYGFLYKGDTPYFPIIYDFSVD